MFSASLHQFPDTDHNLQFFGAFELKRLAADQLQEPIMLLSPPVSKEQYLGLLPLILYPLYS